MMVSFCAVLFPTRCVFGGVWGVLGWFGGDSMDRVVHGATMPILVMNLVDVDVCPKKWSILFCHVFRFFFFFFSPSTQYVRFV